MPQSAEIAFPRGGRKKVKSRDISFEDDDLFNDKKFQESGKKKSRRKKGLVSNQEETETKSVIAIECLSMQTLAEGMVLLGCVLEVKDFEVKISLPGCIYGLLPIVNISDAYTKQIKSFAENPDNVEDEVRNLQAMFHVGQIYPCKVMSTKTSGKDLITLSINPRNINEDLQPSSLFHEMLLYSAVQSVEDHGYVMDVGIKGSPGFLRNDSCVEYIKMHNNEHSLSVGQVLPTIVNMSKLSSKQLKLGQSVILTLDPIAIKNSKIHDIQGLSLSAFTPGTIVVAVVEKITEQGIVVDCAGFVGCVHKNHLKAGSDRHSLYSEGKEVQGYVLYVHPVTRVVHLSMLQKPSSKRLNKTFRGLKKWNIVENAVVTSVQKAHICLKVNNNIQGKASKWQLSDLPIQEINLSVNDTVKCRVLALHFLDNMVSVSLKPSVLNATYINPEDVTVGDVFEGEVKKLVSGGMVVVISPGVQGFVRDIHMSDVPLTKPDVMFPKGKKVMCKVIHVDLSSSPAAISLTCKKGMVQTKVPIISSYQEVVPDMLSKGVIVNINDNGLVLMFLNKVQGFVPSSQFGAYKMHHPEKIFFRGQVVKCRVMNCDPENQKLFLSLKIDSTKLFGAVNRTKELSKGKFPVGISKGVSKGNVKRKCQKGKFPVGTIDMSKAKFPVGTIAIDLPHLEVPGGFLLNDYSQCVSNENSRAQNISSDSDDDDSGPVKKRIKIDSDELSEQYIFERENLLMDKSRLPQKAEEFEELIKGSPNSAFLWVRLMAFYLEQMEIDRGRAVAERALKTIAFREEQEKLKVWIAFLNLENIYGTQESLQDIFERALEQNEPIKVYNAMVDIYSKSNKVEEAENLYRLMVKKFHLNKDVWINFGLFYMTSGHPDLARKLMDRSLKSLDQKQHVDVIAKFAQMEFKHGDIIIGKSMFENILQNYRKRTDLWSIYLDLLIKLQEFDSVRKTFEEVITTKLSVRKIQFFFKRYLRFEKEHGTEENVADVTRRAEEIFKSDTY